MTLLIGADPELFLKKNNMHVSAHGLIEGDKRHPQKVKDGAVQVDGMALEINVDPVDNAEKFQHNVNSVLEQLKSMIPDDLEFDIVPSVEFDKNYYNSQPDKSKELGCDPDFDAYTMQPNPTPEASNLRAAGGHVHIGWTEDEHPNDPWHMENCAQLAKQLDYYLGVPSVLLDKDKTRRKLYGLPGAFRAKSYGMEYRTLSNFWIKEPELIGWVFNSSCRAVKDLQQGGELVNGYDQLARNTIKGNSTKTAKSLIREIPQLDLARELLITRDIF